MRDRRIFRPRKCKPSLQSTGIVPRPTMTRASLRRCVAASLVARAWSSSSRPPGVSISFAPTRSNSARPSSSSSAETCLPSVGCELSRARAAADNDRFFSGYQKCPHPVPIEFYRLPVHSILKSRHAKTSSYIHIWVALVSDLRLIESTKSAVVRNNFRSSIEAIRVPAPVKLSLLWASLMSLYPYNDFLYPDKSKG